MGHHSETKLRQILNATFADLEKLSRFSDMTRDALSELDLSSYRFLGKFIV